MTMTANGNLIEALKNSALYTDYERAYSETTGLPIALRPVETWRLPLHGQPKENKFCALMAGCSRACAACLRMQEKLCQSATHEPSTMTCSYGLTEAAVPVRRGNEVIGFLQTGQTIWRKPTEAQFNRVAEQMSEQGLAVDRDAAKKAFFSTEVVSPRKLDSITHLLSIFAEHLSMKSNQIAILQANAEPPVIARAKKYIEEHQSEDLSLGQVAKAVNTSLFYFCKLFKKTTGIGFTEYVSRVRVERAKNLLLNPNLRVSEIAYEVGFQSLTHFNRVFKVIVGQSPTEFREQMPV
jgi:AraC-like DNA-binding protein/ligand-binding sensor protein